MQENIKPYPEDEFKKEFEKSNLFFKIKKDFPFCIFRDLDMNSLLKLQSEMINGNHILTPRQHVSLSIFSLVPFYYLQFIINNNQSSIYDIGCGWNIFKRYVPNIIGLDIPGDIPDQFKYADFYDKNILNFSEYSKKHYEEYENAISINSLHYYPISKIKERIIDFSNLIKPGGMGFATFNLKRMIEYEKGFTTNTPKIKINKDECDKIEKWIREELDNLPFQIEVFELIQLNPNTIDEWLNGNLRIVFKKNLTK